ncbi:MAG TPA: cell wall-binding repeat-containing protein [Humibacter sp.]|nr:cell wall-binding repeat-containing protein [Humibacter sp.]
MTHSLRRNTAHRLLLAAASLSAFLLGVGLMPQSAMATTSTYTLSGQITYGAASGRELPQTVVHVYALTGNGAEFRSDYSTTSSSGAWSVGGVPAGRYRIEFDATQSDQGANAPIWYGNTPYEDQATVVTVTQNTSGLNVTQRASGRISGTVTGPVDDFTSFRAYLWNQSTGLFELVRSTASGNAKPGSNYTIGGLNPGTYLVRFADDDPLSPSFSTQYYQNSPDLYDAVPVTVTVGQDVTGVDGAVGEWGWLSGRIAGASRFATSTTISSTFYGAGDANVAYIADGLSYPDALSASAAAAYEGGPLLLVNPTSVPATVANELKRLQPPRIVVVGGPSAVSAGVFSSLAKLVPAAGIRRVSGLDRYATSRAIASDAFPTYASNGPLDSVFVATGANYPDALVAGSAAGYQGSPLILVKGNASSLDSATTALISSFEPLRTYVVGGTATVSAGIQHSLENRAGATTVLRLGGANRFLTAQAVNSQVFPFADSAFVTTAFGFADALSISAVAGVVGAPLLLATSTCIPYDELTHETRLGVSTYWIIGGTSVLNSAVENLTSCSPTVYADSVRADSSVSPQLVSPAAGSAVPTITPAQAGLPALIAEAHERHK